jgi:hypothetical protein
MEASRGDEPHVIPFRDAPEVIEVDTIELLGRLEAQAEENGRLRAHAESMERVARAERDGRRRMTDTLKRERRTAEALHERAERAEAELAAKTEQAAELERSLGISEQQNHALWAQLAEAGRELALRRRPLWRKLLRRPPAS